MVMTIQMKVIVYLWVEDFVHSQKKMMVSNLFDYFCLYLSSMFNTINNVIMNNDNDDDEK